MVPFVIDIEHEAFLNGVTGLIIHPACNAFDFVSGQQFHKRTPKWRIIWLYIKTIKYYNEGD